MRQVSVELVARCGGVKTHETDVTDDSGHALLTIFHCTEVVHSTQNRTICPGLNKILLWLGASLQFRRDFVRPEFIPCAPVLSAGCWP